MEKEEQELYMKPDTITVITMSRQELDGRTVSPVYNKFSFCKNETSIQELYFDLFKKYAHFHNYGEEGITNFENYEKDEPLSEVDYQVIFKKYFL